MKTRILTALLAVALSALPALAQTANKDILAKHWKISGEFTAAVAAAMPADGYSFRPVPEEMSFGEIMAHIATADRGACAVASGLTAPEIPAKLSAWLKDPGKVDVDKDTDLRFINETFAFCGKAIDEMPANHANTVVGTASRNLTGTEWLWAYFTHTAHHRGQAEVYLRLKGIKPPEYEF